MTPRGRTHLVSWVGLLLVWCGWSSAGWAQPVTGQPCISLDVQSVLQQLGPSSDTSNLTLNSTQCYALDTDATQGPVQFEGTLAVNATQGPVVLRLGFRALQLSLRPGSHLRLANIKLEESLLPAANSDAAALVPSFFVLSGTASFALRNCTVFTLCSSLALLLDWVGTSPLGAAFPTDGKSFLYVPQLVYGGLSLQDTNYTCNSQYLLSDDTAVVNGGSDSLKNVLYTAASIQYRQVQINSSGIKLAAGWPSDIQIMKGPLTLEGSPSGASPALSLEGIALFISLRRGVFLGMKQLVILNSCGVPLPLTPNASAYFISTAPLWSVRFDRSSNQLLVQDSTFVVPASEFKALMYWRVMLLLSRSYPSLSSWLPFFSAFDLVKIDTLTPTMIRLSTFQGAGYAFRNVSITSVLPTEVALDGFTVMPATLCDATQASLTFTDAPYISISSGAEFLNYLVSLRPVPSIPQDQAVTVISLTDDLLKLFLLMDTLPSKAINITTNLAIVGPLSSAGKAYDGVYLDLEDLIDNFVLSPGVHLYLVGLRLLELYSPDASSNAASSRLPLWAFKFDRTSSVSVHLYNCTILLKSSEYDEAYRTGMSITGYQHHIVNTTPQATFLSYFTGYGVEGVDVMLMPLPSGALLVGSHDHSDISLTTWQLALVVVGSTLAGLLILLSIVLVKRALCSHTAPGAMVPQAPTQSLKESEEVVIELKSAEEPTRASPPALVRFPTTPSCRGLVDSNLNNSCDDQQGSAGPVSKPESSPSGTNFGKVVRTASDRTDVSPIEASLQQQQQQGMGTSTLPQQLQHSPSIIATNSSGKYFPLQEPLSQAAVGTPAYEASTSLDQTFIHPGMLGNSASVYSSATGSVQGPLPAFAASKDDVSRVLHLEGAGPGSGDLASSGPLDEVKRMMHQIASVEGNDADKLLIFEQVGQGGHGVVHKGRWKGLEVAVKTILFQDRASLGTNGTQAGEMRQRSLREAAVCYMVSHPNLVATYHYDIMPVQGVAQVGLNGMEINETRSEVTDYKLYLVQEFCDASLSNMCERHLLHGANSQPLLSYMLPLLMDIARGMAYLHKRNIVHGDLNTSNVMVKVDASSPVNISAKITDFGLCALLDPRQTHVSNHNRGTPFYTAPEVVVNGQLTKASDVYAFGVILWELYNKALPWLVTPEGQFVHNPAFPQMPGDAPAAYSGLVGRCLDFNPKSRPTFQQILAVLGLLHVHHLQTEALVKPFESNLVEGQPQQAAGSSQVPRELLLLQPMNPPRAALMFTSQATGSMSLNASQAPAGSPLMFSSQHASCSLGSQQDLVDTLAGLLGHTTGAAAVSGPGSIAGLPLVQPGSLLVGQAQAQSQCPPSQLSLDTPAVLGPTSLGPNTRWFQQEQSHQEPSKAAQTVAALAATPLAQGQGQQGWGLPPPAEGHRHFGPSLSMGNMQPGGHGPDTAGSDGSFAVLSALSGGHASLQHGVLQPLHAEGGTGTASAAAMGAPYRTGAASEPSHLSAMQGPASGGGAVLYAGTGVESPVFSMPSLSAGLNSAHSSDTFPHSPCSNPPHRELVPEMQLQAPPAALWASPAVSFTHQTVPHSTPVHPTSGAGHHHHHHHHRKSSRFATPPSSGQTQGQGNLLHAMQQQLAAAAGLQPQLQLPPPDQSHELSLKMGLELNKLIAGQTAQSLAHLQPQSPTTSAPATTYEQQAQQQAPPGGPPLDLATLQGQPDLSRQFHLHFSKSNSNSLSASTMSTASKGHLPQLSPPPQPFASSSLSLPAASPGTSSSWQASSLLGGLAGIPPLLLPQEAFANGSGAAALMAASVSPGGSLALSESLDVQQLINSSSFKQPKVSGVRHGGSSSRGKQLSPAMVQADEALRRAKEQVKIQQQHRMGGSMDRDTQGPKSKEKSEVVHFGGGDGGGAAAFGKLGADVVVAESAHLAPPQQQAPHHQGSTPWGSSTTGGYDGSSGAQFPWMTLNSPFIKDQ